MEEDKDKTIFTHLYIPICGQCARKSFKCFFKKEVFLFRKMKVFKRQLVSQVFTVFFSFCQDINSISVYVLNIIY